MESPTHLRPITKIIVDTREQKPLLFENYKIKTARDKLDAGDYSLVGHDRPGDDYSLIIERKENTQELLNNISSKWEQFVRELELMRKYKYRFIIVCGPNNVDHLIRQGFTRMTSAFIHSQYAKIMMDYEVPIIWADSRANAEEQIYRICTNILKKMLNEEQQQ